MLPQRTEALENEQQALYATASDPAFHKKEKSEIAAIKKRLADVAAEIAAAYARWEMLDDMQP
jgi:ATP-binding cassette subfamily F protein uup